MSDMSHHPAATMKAVIYRMVMSQHTCPYGLMAKDMLKRAGYEVDDRHLTRREETDAFKAEHGVQTTPQTFIGGERIGGYDDLRRYFGKSVRDPKAVTYRPVQGTFTLVPESVPEGLDPAPPEIMRPGYYVSVGFENFTRAFTISLVLIFLGALGTFPSFFEMFTAH